MSIDEVRDRTDITTLVSDYVTLKKAGKTHKGLCPFHGEKTPSFVVYPDEGRWHCFGACATGGDAFDFVMQIEGLDFKGALELLARRAGVTLAPPSPRAQEQKDQRGRLRAALARAQELFHSQLLGGPGTAARAYLAERGYDATAAAEFGLGWAPDSWEGLVGRLRSEGFADAELVTAGLARERDTGGIYDAFRGRLMFPIRDPQGRMAGFGARTLDPNEQPKYLNSPQSPIFDKGRFLFALDRAAPAMRDAEEAVVVEGYTDVIRAHMAGYRNVVASLGTALTEHHLATLKRYVPRIVLALDADAAGQHATMRGLDVAREAAAGDVMPVPTAQGWIRYEQRLAVDLRVATLPAGKDPDDVIRADPEAWRRLVSEARPVLAFLFDALTADLALDTPQGKTEAARRLTPVLASVPDPVSRSAWVSEFADKMRVDPRALAGQIAKSGSQQRRTPGGGTPQTRRSVVEPPRTGADRVTASRNSSRLRSRWFLGHLLSRPDRYAEVAEALEAVGQAPPMPADLDGRIERDLLEAVRNAGRGSPAPDTPREHQIDRLPEEHAALVEELLAATNREPELEERLLIRWLRDAVLSLRKKQREQALAGLRYLQADAPAADLAEYRNRARDVARELHVLHGLLARDLAAITGKVDQGVTRRREI